jgi:DNA-binding transcriptional MerR regulator
MTVAPPIGRPPSVGSRLTISRAARLAGLTIRAIRLYEERGLVSSQRDGRDNRSFGAAELERLIAIGELRAIGASLDEISGLLSADALVGDAGGSQELADLLNDHRQRLLHRLSCLETIARRKGVTLTQVEKHLAKVPDRRANRGSASPLSF